MRPLCVVFLISLSCQATVIDRIAVITGKQVIKLSDVDRNLRAVSFLNRQPVDLSAKARHAAADRLVDQQIIRDEIAAQGFARATDEEANDLQKQIAAERFGGSQTQLRNELQRYGLTEQQLHQQLLWQLTVLQFINERFHPAALVTDEEIAAYYRRQVDQIRKESPANFSLEAASPKIRKTLEAQRTDQEFESWLEQARKQMRIEYREAAFQ